MKKITSLLLIALLGLSGCSAPSAAINPPPSKPPLQQTSTASLADLLQVQPVFANSQKFYVTPVVTPAIKEMNTDLAQVKNLDLLEKALALKLSPEQRDFLQKNRFLLLDAFSEYQKFCFNSSLLTDRENCHTYLTSTPPNPPEFMVALFKAFAGSPLEYERNQANSIYVNADIILHTYHVFVDRYFKKLEQQKLYPLLRDMIATMQQQAISELQKSSAESKASLERVAGYLTIGKVLLETAATPQIRFDTPDDEDAWREKDQKIDQSATAFLQNLEHYKNNFSPEYFEKMKQELELIVGAKSPQVSPLFGLYNPKGVNDYTQFTPRSHYNENSILRAYFRAMMLFGRQTFYFGSNEGLTDGATLAFLLQKSGKEQDWATLSDITDFFAGAADDITYKQFKKTLEVALGANMQLSDIFNEGQLQKIKAEASKLPNPKIVSEIIVEPRPEDMANKTKEDLLLMTKGFRLFGQKFTFDAWVLNQMTAGHEKTDIKLPSTPSALFIAAALGSEQVKEFLPKWIEKSEQKEVQSEQLWNKLNTLRNELSAVTPQSWLGNIGSGWLWTLAPLLKVYGQGYPAYMQSQPYQQKNLQTVLGSYTELKHDTLLYAKQSYAELGGFGGIEKKSPEVAKGFVEPDLEFWARMIALAKFTEEGLLSRNMLEDTVKGRLDNFIENLQFYQKLAEKELTNQKISDAEYETLRTDLWKTTDIILSFEGEDIPEKDKKPALIADVHTDALKNQILYEATGNPLLMLTLVSDQGTPRLTIGVAYRHFEFPGPIASRYTDEQWKERVDKKDLPETPFFYQDLFVRK